MNEDPRDPVAENGAEHIMCARGEIVNIIKYNTLLHIIVDDTEIIRLQAKVSKIKIEPFSFPYCDVCIYSYLRQSIVRRDRLPPPLSCVVCFLLLYE